jgi:hypothetical protein
VTSAGVAVTGTLSSSGASTLTGAITATAGINTPNTFGFKNRIINGGMVIDQRNAGASVTINNTGAFQYVVDRFYGFGSTASKFTLQQNAGSVTPPVGFTNYLGATSSSAYSITSSDIMVMGQEIEGFNVADLGWGTANAQPVTLSFWVRSSLTGTFGGAISNSAQDRSYPFSYTISSANTWEQKSVTIAGDTSGSWLTTNGVGLRVRFGLGCGSTFSGTAGAWASANLFSATGATSVVGTSGATFYITGVQLEKGSTATSFDFRAYSTELALCQRYCNVFTNSDSTNQRHSTFAMAPSTTGLDAAFSFKASMRTAPSLLIDTIGNLRLSDGLTANTPTGYSITSAVNGLQQAIVAFAATGLTAFRPYFVEANGTLNSAKITFSAEL